MGIASVVHIVMGVVRMKFAAVLLGPAGVGLIGILQSLMAVAAVIATFGMDTVGTRQIASAPDQRHQGIVAWALVIGLLGLGATAGLCFVILREPISQLLVGQAETKSRIGWIAAGITLSVAATAQLALLNGLRQISMILWLKVLSALAATALCVAALLSDSILQIQFFIIAMPLSSFAIGQILVWRIRRSLVFPVPYGLVVRQIRVMARQGAPIMLAGLSMFITQLAVRAIVQRGAGSESLGQFEAAWMISMTYLGFVLGAMATDYFPRLSLVIADPVAASRLVNEQTEVALILVGPALILLMAFAPLVVRVLYTAEFLEAANTLRWQILGDLLKTISWPLGFVLLASESGRTYLFVEAIAAIVFVGVVALLVEPLGVEGAGIGFLAMYLVYAPVVYAVARQRIGFRWSTHVIVRVFALGATLGAIFNVSQIAPQVAMVAGGIFALLFTFEGVAAIRRTMGKHE
jgi:O-antigen/teichoic acid export membrane protein